MLDFPLQYLVLCAWYSDATLKHRIVFKTKNVLNSATHTHTHKTHLGPDTGVGFSVTETQTRSQHMQVALDIDPDLFQPLRSTQIKVVMPVVFPGVKTLCSVLNNGRGASAAEVAATDRVTRPMDRRGLGFTWIYICLMQKKKIS